MDRNFLKEAERQIKDIQRAADEQIKTIQKLILAEVAKDFEAIGWDRWTIDEHLRKGQYQRFSKARTDENLTLLYIDLINCAGMVHGSQVYDVSGDGCSCTDFALRGLPCKHMYFLAAELTARRRKK